jgi:LacI family transcriptional regulator
VLTIKEIAKIAGVCPATVDKVIHNRPGVKEKTRLRVQKVISDVGFKPNIAGKALRLQSRRLTLVASIYVTDSFPHITAGIQEQLKNYEDFGLYVELKPVNYADAAAQCAILEECDEKNVAGVILAPLNDTRIVRAVNKLAEKNIPVITVNNDLPGSGRSCFVGQNLWQAGRAAARLMSAFTGGRGTVAAVTGSEDLLSDIDRLAGFLEFIKDENPELKLVKTIQTHEDPLRTYQETAELLHEYPGLNGIYITTGRVREVGRAVSTLGFAGKVKIVCFDLYDDIRELVHQGVINCTIGQDLHRQGTLPVQLFFQHFYYNQDLPHGELFTPIDIRIPENIDFPLNC